MQKGDAGRRVTLLTKRMKRWRGIRGELLLLESRRKMTKMKRRMILKMKTTKRRKRIMMRRNSSYQRKEGDLLLKSELAVNTTFVILITNQTSH